jgi:hypothetical protein
MRLILMRGRRGGDSDFWILTCIIVSCQNGRLFAPI